MAARPPARPSLDDPAYFVRVTTRDHRAIEEAMAGATLLDTGARLDGAVIEASYAANHPPLLKRLGDDGVQRILESQSLRFVGANFLETESLTRLPYAPDSRITAGTFDVPRARTLSRGALLFAQDRGADVFVAPGLPLHDASLDRWIEHNAAILSATCAVNGGADVERRPLLALVAPGSRALADPDRVVDLLLDHPISGVYVQALTLNPIKDSLEKLARFVQFLTAIRSAGFPIVVGRVGAFGLVLQSLGFAAFDSGLGLAETHSLSSLNRPLTERERERRRAEGGGGPASRVYLEPLKTTLAARAARAIVASEALRQHFACTHGCCRFRDVAELDGRARIHYLHARRSEVDQMRALPIAAMRLHQMETQLRSARDLAARVRRALPETDLPDFTHLDRWLGLLAREQEAAMAA